MVCTMRTVGVVLLMTLATHVTVAQAIAEKRTSFEMLTLALDTAVAQARETRAVLLVVARPGHGESVRTAQFRLQVIRCYISQLHYVPAQVFFAEGRPCPRAGRVELYVGGKRFGFDEQPFDLVMPRGGITNPWGEDPDPVLTTRSFGRYRGRCATNGHSSLESPPN